MESTQMLIHVANLALPSFQIIVLNSNLGCGHCRERVLEVISKRLALPVCHQLGRKSSAVKCSSCASSSTLAACIECGIAFCDSAGHLNEHIRTHPSHRQFYSYRLNRLIKCCKPTCKVTDIKDLLACHYCFDKAFDKFYDMYTATWKGAGLSIIWGSICCEDHFEWHRMNCSSAGVEDSAYIVKKQDREKKRVQLSDFIF